MTTSKSKAAPPGFTRYEFNKTYWDVPVKYIHVISIKFDAYGSVCSAYNKDLKVTMAVKKLARPFLSVTHAKRTYRELRLLKHMHHENVVGLLDVFSPSSTIENFNDVYLVTHLMDKNLNKIVKSHKLTDDHIRLLIYQLLCGLKYMHSAGIIHRDLKPSNIGVNEDWRLRILNCGLTHDEVTSYVAARWYCAPEILYEWASYNNTVDVWSVGCILAELVTGQTLFPGTDHIDQFKRILALCGNPSEELLSRTSSLTQSYIEQLQVFPPKNFASVFVNADVRTVSLLESMLVLDMDRRFSAEQALEHPYFENLHDQEFEFSAPPYDKSYEDDELSIEEWKKLTFDEVTNFELSSNIIADLDAAHLFNSTH